MGRRSSCGMTNQIQKITITSGTRHDFPFR
jgi:hypothetical protein